jgi:hypothetical protein
MEQLLPEILKLGSAGIIAGIFLWLYIEERKEHRETRRLYIESLAARLDDSKHSVTKVTDALGGIALGIQTISDKIEISKRG